MLKEHSLLFGDTLDLPENYRLFCLTICLFNFCYFFILCMASSNHKVCDKY